MRKLREFKCKNGTLFHIRYISENAMSSFYEFESLPIPEKVIEVGFNGEKRIIPDYENEAYLAAKQQRDGQNFLRAAKGVILAGVTDNPSDDEYEFYHGVVSVVNPRATKNDVRYMWIMDQLGEGELERLTDAITSQSKASEGDIEKSVERFQDAD